MGSLLGIINKNSNQNISAPKEIKDYKPPKKENKSEPKLFNEDFKKAPTKKKIAKERLF